MLNRTLAVAALATVSMPVVGAETSTPATPPRDTDPQQLGRIRVQDSADEEASLKAQTQTSASKIELTLRETPQSVTVITNESLEARQVFDFGQALELSAGVNQYSGTGPFAGQAAFGFNEVTIRGIAVDSLYDVREDGFVNTTYFVIPDMAIYDRIEIIKGPSSVVYGRGSAGGVVNRVRKKPLAEQRGQVEMSVGSFDTYRADADLTGALNAANTVRGRFVAAYEDSGSFVDGVEKQRAVLAPSLDFDITATTRLLLEGLYQHDEFVPNTGFALVDEGNGRFRGPNVARSLLIGRPSRADNEWDIRSGTVQLDQALGDAWLASLRFNKNNTKSPVRTDRYAYGFQDGYTQLTSSEFIIDRDVWAGELQLTGELEIARMPVKIAAGVELNDNDYHRRGAYAYLGTVNIYSGNFDEPPDMPLSPGFDYATDNKARGAYVQAQMRPIEPLSVLLGLRYDDTDSVYNALTTSVISRKKEAGTSGRVGLTYDATEQISVYGLYARSFSPVLFDVDASGEILDAEQGEIYEIGAKSEWLDGRLAVTAAVYRIDRTHIPVAAEVGPADPPYSISSGLQRSEGFEIELTGSPRPGWELGFAYNHLDSAFEDPRDAFYGLQPGGTADWQVSLFSTYELQTGPLLGFGFGATVFAIDERGVSTFVPGALEGYERMDLHLFYKGLPQYEFALQVRNATDERYIEGADRTNAIAFFGAPTAALLTVRRNFGRSP